MLMLLSLCPLLFSLCPLLCPSHCQHQKMPTNKATNPTSWTICSGGLLGEDSEDSDFPSDQESTDSSSSSDLELIISGDNEVISKAHATCKGKEILDAKSL
jgi:hypothetical protein